jgi:hypothetical protein
MVWASSLARTSSSRIQIERFDQAVQAIKREFPALQIDLIGDHPSVHAIAEMHVQAGLDFEVIVNLQNGDELHLNAGEHFRVEWFPCGEEQVFKRFMEAVIGTISGEFRIVETFVFGSPAKAELQRPDGHGGWKRVATWANLRSLVPWFRSRQILQNKPKT